MTHKARTFTLVLLLALSLIVVGRTNATSLINAIVASTEAVLPYITQLSPADQALVTAYINGAVTITDTLLKCGQSVPICVSTAVTQFNALIVPTLSPNVSPTVRELISVVAVAIAAFVAAEGNVTPVGFSISDSKKIEFKTRITVVKTKLGPYLKH